MRVLLIDDHPCIMKGIARLLEEMGGYIIAGMVRTWSDAQPILLQRQVDLVLLDIELSENENGFHLIGKIRSTCPVTKIVVFSSYDNHIYRAKARAVGADEYIAKGCDFEFLNQKLLTVAKSQRTASGFANSVNRLNTLSAKEEAVIYHLARGMLHKQIADQLNIKPSTVATYVQRAKEKLGVTSNAELFAKVGLLGNGVMNQGEVYG